MSERLTIHRPDQLREALIALDGSYDEAAVARAESAWQANHQTAQREGKNFVPQASFNGPEIDDARNGYGFDPAGRVRITIRDEELRHRAEALGFVVRAVAMRFAKRSVPPQARTLRARLRALIWRGPS